MADREYHVASYVVRTRPDDAPKLAEEIGSIEGIEVHAAEAGNLIVTAEADNVRRIAELADELETLKRVIAVAPVYHEYSSAEEAAAQVPRDK